jgi:hypothetical protein
MTPTMKEGEMQLKITRALRSSAMRNRNCMSLPKSEGVIPTHPRLIFSTDDLLT